MRESQKYALEEELREKVLARIVIIQRWVRAKLLRCRFLHIRRSAIVLQVWNIWHILSVCNLHVQCIVPAC